MIRTNLCAIGVVAVCLACVPCGSAAAADTWTQVKSPHFTVISDAGERKARDVAWQLEQVRSAIADGYRWARVQLNLPVVVFAVRNESSMKALVPEYWERGAGVHPTSVFGTGLDRHYIALRADVQSDDRDGINPYNQAFWSYSGLTLESAFNHGLPLWFTTGLAAVLSNTIARDTEIQFGRPLPAFVREVRGDARFPLRELFAVTLHSPGYTHEPERGRYVAQCWALMHYLLFGNPSQTMRVQGVNDLAKRLLTGTPAATAVEQVFGSVDALDRAYVQYVQGGFFRYTRMQIDKTVLAKDFPTRDLTPAEAAAARGAFHASRGRAEDARREIDEARRAEPGLAAIFDVEGTLADEARDAVRARAAYARATELSSVNFFSYYRLAALIERADSSAGRAARMEPLLQKAIGLNDASGSSFALLAEVQLQLGQLERALTSARRAVELEPADFSDRMVLASVLGRQRSFDQARKTAQDALEFARTDAERQAVSNFLDLVSRAAAATRPDGRLAAEGRIVASAKPVQAGDQVKPPVRVHDVPAVYPAAAQAAGVEGAVVLQITIGADGHVLDAVVRQSIPTLDQAAIDAVKQWEYTPTLVNGVAVPVTMTVTVTFHLK